MKGKRRLWLFGVGLLAVPTAVILAAAILPPPELERPSAQVVTDQNGHWLRAFAAEDDIWRLPVRYADLPPSVTDAVLTFEDRRFFHHVGVDPLALLRAAWLNLRAGRVVSGGSTITMQIARMIEQRPRTLKNKVREMFTALQLELSYEKEELLEHYLTLAPYGGNIEGITAAAYFYFGKSVKQLSLEEAATLAALPNAPSRLRPDRASGRIALKKRRDEVLRRMAARNRISSADAASTIALSLSAERRSPPMDAPHLAELIHRRSPRAIARSTIDVTLQRRAQDLMAQYIGRLDQRGIENGALVIIENETRAVRAWVGSADFNNNEHQGQVDGAAAFRSPGSTLKPFVYALALERGLISINSLLADVPLHFPDWSPGNFDGSFRGVVTAQDALAASLNVPAVQLSQALEPHGIIDLLQRASFSRFTKRLDRYGLSVVLGGCEVRLVELTNLYATLARGGMHQPHRVVEDRPPQKEQRLLDEGATYLVSEILTDVRRPELADVWRDAISLPRIAWKTGTSYGRRDAWSIGYNRHYTVGVWVGNFDGRGAPSLVGGRTAAPLLFSVVRMLPQQREGWLRRPATVIKRKVCALSGKEAGLFCPNKKTELALIDQAPRTLCDLHTPIDVDNETGYRLCARCRGGRSHHREVHVVWPAKVASFLSSTVPKHNPACSSAIAGTGPIIHSPLHGDQFWLRRGIPSEQQQIALLASSHGSSDQIFWFVDDRLEAKVHSGKKVMLDPAVGLHQLVAVDGEGRSTSIQIRIR